MNRHKPATPSIGFGLGLALAALVSPLFGQERDASDEALKALKAANGLFARGVHSFERNETDKAVGALEECVRTMPSHAFARYYLANILYIRKDYAGALAQMETSLANYDAMVDLWDRADRLRLADMDAVLRSLGKIGEMSPSCRDDRSVEFFGGQVADKELQIQDAAKRRRQAQARMKGHYIYFYGNVLFQLQRYADAAGRYEEALRIDPSHANAYNNLAAIFFLGKLYQNALEVLDRAEANGIEDFMNLKLKEAVYAAVGRPTAGILQEDIPPAREGGPAVARFSLGIRPSGSALPPFYENAYLVYDPGSGDAVLIDPGLPDARIIDYAAERKLAVKAVLNTHGHPDHVGGNRHYAGRFKAPVFAAEDAAGKDPAKPDRSLRDGETLDGGRLRIEVIAIAGHSPGGVCFKIGDCLFSGDTLFRNGIGKPGTDEADEASKLRKAMIQRIRDRLLSLPDDTRLFPGHGKASSIAEEKEGNPALK